MLVKTAPFKWSRDPEVSDLIEHLDKQWDKQYDSRLSFEENKLKSLAALSKGEMGAIENEFDLCQEDFSYAARNYFWIEDKETRRDILFKLWPSQELILEKIMALRAMGVSQRIITIKARQLGISTVVEGLGAWRTVYFRNINGLIISHDSDHAAYLFRITQKIYDMLPWWMKPQCASREFKDGLIFDNPDYEDRSRNPGLNSTITAMGANARNASAQGRRLSWTHLSEFGSWDESTVRNIIEEDVSPALSSGPETFAVMESTAKGAGRYAHWKWLECVRLGDKADWVPIFFPWFFDKSLVVPVGAEWQPQQHEAEMRDRASKDWLRCDYEPCRQYRLRLYGGHDWTGDKCPTCDTGTLCVHVIPNNQLAWFEYRRLNAEGDEESYRRLKQERASTPEEAFQSSGTPLFSEKAQRWAQLTIEEPRFTGRLDKMLKLHGVNPETGHCWIEQCDMDHRNDDKSLKVWEKPVARAEYMVGADVSHGLGGKNDYSAITVLRLNKYGADEQVAAYARNDIDAIAFAEALWRVGKWYNDALLACEMNLPTTANYLQMTMNYPNLYRMKSQANSALMTSRMGWLTNEQSKASLYQNMRNRLENRMTVMRDRRTVEELKTFQKDTERAKTGAARGFHDDCVMSYMIAAFCAHDGDWDEEAQSILDRVPLTLENAPIVYACHRCHQVWPSREMFYKNCPKCGCMHIAATQNADINAPVVQDPESQIGSKIDYYAGFADTMNKRVIEKYLNNGEPFDGPEMRTYDEL